MLVVSFSALASQKLTIKEAASCQWYYNNKLIDGETDNSIGLTVSGNYTAVYENATGATVRSTTFFNASTGQKIKLFVIGDSTASKYDASRYPRTGWAQVFQPFFVADSVEVVDKALSGRSSKSFYYEGAGWPSVKSALSTEDYLFIQFGHNDAKSDEERHTDPYTTYKEYLKKYIDEARSKGAIPVLLTPIHRNGWSGSSIKNSHGDYPAAMRQLAVEEDVPLIDLTAKTATLFESYGQDVVTNQFFMNIPANVYSTYPDGNSDNTHLQDRGAFEVSNLVYKAFSEQKEVADIAKLYRSSTKAGFIKVDINSYGLGTVTGNKVVAIGSKATLKAYSKAGYVFSGYVEGDEVKSKEANYSFVVSDSLLFLTAKFVKGYKVNVTLTPKYKGKVAGLGTFAPGDSVTIVVTPYSNYDFDNWSVDETVVSTDSSYTFIMDAEDVTLLANLKIEGASAIEESEIENISMKYIPSSNEFAIVSSCLLVTISVFDINGKKIKEIVNVDNETAYVSAAELADGIYIINAKTKDGNHTDKLIKN